ncbi:unnamed protein product [Lactuca virosa]|uniref:Uncharacterized protein n=1 Tax=Lactuca virosa TaxID=75947 RepID=A0AAU9N419_9ASTR|nr:unnamed protein product [Lactuca virosa]
MQLLPPLLSVNKPKSSGKRTVEIWNRKTTSIGFASPLVIEGHIETGPVDGTDVCFGSPFPLAFFSIRLRFYRFHSIDWFCSSWSSTVSTPKSVEGIPVDFQFGASIAFRPVLALAIGYTISKDHMEFLNVDSEISMGC